MEIHNYDDMITVLHDVRKKFYHNSAVNNHIFEEVFNLFIETRKLIQQVVVIGDEEINILKVLDVTFRRVVSTYILIESGLRKEAGIVLRNAIEFLLIAIDIAYCQKSLHEWIKSENDNIEENGGWYFKPTKIYNRINNDDKNQIYPKWERNMVIYEDINRGNGLYAEWKRSSNTFVHVHSKAQISNLFDSYDNFYLFTYDEVGEYTKDFYQLRIQLMMIISLLLSIPKYKNKLEEQEELSVKLNDIISRIHSI